MVKIDQKVVKHTTWCLVLREVPVVIRDSSTCSMSVPVLPVEFDFTYLFVRVAVQCTAQ
jgi:hypothetical protein